MSRRRNIFGDYDYFKMHDIGSDLHFDIDQILSELGYLFKDDPKPNPSNSDFRTNNKTKDQWPPHSKKGTNGLSVYELPPWLFTDDNNKKVRPILMTCTSKSDRSSSYEFIKQPLLTYKRIENNKQANF